MKNSVFAFAVLVLPVLGVNLTSSGMQFKARRIGNARTKACGVADFDGDGVLGLAFPHPGTGRHEIAVSGPSRDVVVRDARHCRNALRFVVTARFADAPNGGNPRDGRGSQRRKCAILSA